MSHCFTYGSLMCADIMALVCGHEPPSTAATLVGYRRHPVRDEDYPGILPAPDGRVEGRLYEGLRPEAWERLDRFEGPQYERILVQVLGQDQTPTTAWTYLFRPQYRALLQAGEWDFAAFLAHGKARFIARYMGFEQLQQ